MVNLNPSLISNPAYRAYVSEKEQDVKKTKFNKSTHTPPDVNIFPKYRSGPDVRTSHLYPNVNFTFIKPFQYNKIVKTSHLNNIQDDAVYVGTRRYTRANVPNKILPTWV